MNDHQSEEQKLLRELIDCLEYREGGAHVQVIAGKGAIFWETMYALKRRGVGPQLSADGGKDITL